jgi:hypothetical protein
MSKAQIIQGIMEKLSRTMRVAIPATIVTYDYAHQKASVQISLKEYYSDENIMEYPIISNVPVMFLSSGEASFTMPVKKDDRCLLLFMDRDISAWSLGSDNEAPRSRRSHHLNDAIAVLGLNNIVTNSKAENNEDVLITYAGSDIRLKPDGKIDIHSGSEINIKTQEIVINCTNANLTASGDVNTTCENAIVKANGKIDTETPTFTQKGNFNVEGDVNITGKSDIGGNLSVEGKGDFKKKLTCDKTIEGNKVKTSSGIDLDKHKHSYTEAIAGSNPTAVQPSTTGQAS